MSVAPTSTGDDGSGPPTEADTGTTTTPRGTSGTNNTGVNATGTQPPEGYVSPDYSGSYEEWYEQTVRMLLDRYTSGTGGEGWADEDFQSPYGAPDPNDFGEGEYGPQTERFIERFVENEGERSNFILEHMGPPPERNATYVEDPNAPGVIAQENRKAQAEEAEKDRQARIKSAEISAEASKYGADKSAEASKYAADVSAEASKYSADQATERTMAQIESAEKIAGIDDATRRYIAEGEWGVQKWVTEQNNQAAMDRLELQLGMQEKELAQRAIEERNRHQARMVGLAMEVAQYDAELAASPRNLMKYAAWLQNRNMVVDGLSVAMAAQEVPEDMIDPEEVAETTGDNMAAMQTAQERQNIVDGKSGGALQNMSPEELNQILGGGDGETAQDVLGTGNVEGQNQTAFAQQQQQQPGEGMLPQAGQSPSPEELDQMDPGDLANRLLGSNPLAPEQGEFSSQNLQGLMESTRTSGREQAGFGAYSGPTRNALGVDIPEVSGKDVDYREFSDLLPTEQGIKASGVESVRGPSGVTDWGEELLRSRPKGRARGNVSFG